MREQAKAFEAAKAVKAVKAKADDNTFLKSKKWLPVKLIDRKQLSKDTFTYTFSYDQDSRTHGPRLKHGLDTCQHIRFGIHILDKMLVRSFTPTRPISARDENGTFNLTVKTYFSDDKQPGGAFSNFLYELPLGRRVEVYGPTGGIAGYVTAEIMKKHLFPPAKPGCKDEEQVLTFLCGPAAMIQKAAPPALKSTSSYRLSSG
jgi:nitrate reductase (NAD(P)H)